MKFEWDHVKNELNIRKHNIDFSDAQYVFDGPMIIRLDDKEEYSEYRWRGTGFLGNIIVVVIFSEPVNDLIRLISARKANYHERKRFETEIKNRLG